MKVRFYVEGILKRKDLKISLQLTYSIEFLNIRFWILLDRNLEILTYDGGPTVRIQNIGRYPAVYVVNLSSISNKNGNFENSPKNLNLFPSKIILELKFSVELSHFHPKMVYFPQNRSRQSKGYRFLQNSRSFEILRIHPIYTPRYCLDRFVLAPGHYTVLVLNSPTKAIFTLDGDPLIFPLYGLFL